MDGTQIEEIGDFEVIEHQESADKEHAKQQQQEKGKEIVTVRDDNLGYNMQIDSMTKRIVKRPKARGSMSIPQPVLTASALETFQEHQLEDEAAAINGPADDINAAANDNAHTRTDTMNSNSTA